MFAHPRDGSDDAERGRLLGRAVARWIGGAEVQPVATARQAVLAEATRERDRIAALALGVARERAGRDVVAGRVVLVRATGAALERGDDLGGLAQREPD